MRLDKCDSCEDDPCAKCHGTRRDRVVQASVAQGIVVMVTANGCVWVRTEDPVHDGCYRLEQVE